MRTLFEQLHETACATGFPEVWRALAIGVCLIVVGIALLIMGGGV
jgi:hypothetical protein